ncbi:MAG: long-chain fatty acid--CoA ligase, partial [Beijerinckiaceae bacterium]|nr:long-chain fatty acid--CoA ligase [Beijerinckiaceae bacterium]
VAAYLVLREGANVTGEEIRQFARQKLTGYKVPVEVFFRKELPKSNIGKILRRELREQVAAEAAS